MDITYLCMDVWLWLLFMAQLDIVAQTAHDPFIIVEFENYVHAYIVDTVNQEVCHVKGHAK